MQSLEDGEAIIKDLAEREAQRSRSDDTDSEHRRGVVVGAGYIGVEMAEAMAPARTSR